jgi:hypothetical protein
MSPVAPVLGQTQSQTWHWAAIGIEFADVLPHHCGDDNEQQPVAAYWEVI